MAFKSVLVEAVRALVVVELSFLLRSPASEGEGVNFGHFFR